MKFSLFGHMERLGAGRDHETLYEEFIGYCKLADEGGMRAVWTGEHHAMDFTIAPNPFINLVDIAHHTKRLRLGTGTVVAPFWHPIKLAGEAAMTDLVTGGRLELGIARGAYSYEYERLMPGLDAWDAGQRMRETVPVLRKLWDGDYAHDGQFYQFPATSSAPKPKQPEGPPIWIAARDPSSHEFAIENDCNVQVTPLWQGLDEATSLMAKFRDASDKIKPKTTPRIMLLHHCYVSANDAELEQAVKDFHRFYGYFGAWFKNERAVKQGCIDPLSDEEIAANKVVTASGIRNDLTLGSASDVIDRIRRYEDLGYDEFSYWIDSGMSPEQKHSSLCRFIDEVMPRFS